MNKKGKKKTALTGATGGGRKLARNDEYEECLTPDFSFKGYTRGREGIQVFMFHVTVKQNLFIYI